MKAQYLLDTRGPQAIPRKTQIQIWPNMAASQIAMRYGLHGPSLTVTTACASSLDAIGNAARLIEADRRTCSSRAAPRAVSAAQVAEPTATSCRPRSTRAGSTA